MRGLVACGAAWLVACAAPDDGCRGGDRIASLPTTPAFAVVRSNGVRTAIALIADDGAIVDGDLVDAHDRLSPLPLDVALPSTPLQLGAVSWIEPGRDRLVVADLVGGVVPIEASVAGLAAHPSDAVDFGDGFVLVTRPGIAPDALDPLARGGDLVVVDRDRLETRIELGGDAWLDATVCGGAACLAEARPTVLLPFGRRSVLVVFERVTLDGRHHAPSAALVVDTVTMAVSAPVDLRGLVGCSSAALADTQAALVLCTGPALGADGAPASDDERRALTGIVRVSRGGLGLEVVRVLAPHASAPVPTRGVVPLDDGVTLYVATEGSVDHLVALSSSGFPSVIAEVPAGSLGDGVSRGPGRGALVPDASTTSILRIEPRVGGPPHLVAHEVLDDCASLPPRTIRPIAF